MLRFNSKKCVHFFKSELAIALEKLQTEYSAEIESHMLTPEGKNDVYLEAVEVMVDYITAEVIIGPWGIMDSYGTGSLMDKSNPALADYIQSELWNKYRGNDTKIRSRSRGYYINIFGDKVYSSSNVPGIDLEKKGGKYSPTPPSKALQTALKWMIQGDRINKTIKKVIDDFNFDRFVEEK